MDAAFTTLQLVYNIKGATMYMCQLTHSDAASDGAVDAAVNAAIDMAITMYQLANNKGATHVYMPPNMKLMDVVVDAAMDAAMDNYYITSHVQSACIGQDDAALDAAKVSYNIKKGFHIMESLSIHSIYEITWKLCRPY